MAHPYFFLCPECLAEDSIVSGKCQQCKTTFSIKHTTLYCGNEGYHATDYARRVISRLSLLQTASEKERLARAARLLPREELIRISGAGLLRQGGVYLNFTGMKKLFTRRIEKPVKRARGFLLIYPEHLEFCTSDKVYQWPASEITCITTNGHYFEFKLRHQPFMQIKFVQESPWKYELLLREWLTRYYQQKDGRQIVEFQPRVRFSYPRPGRREWIPASTGKAGFKYAPVIAIGRIVRALLGTFISVTVRGKENWVADQTGVVLVNHQSILDPFIVGGFWDPNIAFLTKSTSFTHLVERVFLKITSALPTTRYQNDPEVLYLMRRFLSMGRKVGVFPEGERNWDGRLLPFKLGLVKALMASRQPLFPLVLRDAYECWPRWNARPHRAAVDIDILPPFSLNPHWPRVEDQQAFLHRIFEEAIEHDNRTK